MPGTFAGMPVIAASDWPRVLVGTEDVVIAAHPLIVRLLDLCPFLPQSWGVFMSYSRPIYRDRDPLIISGRVYCSLGQLDALMHEAAKPERRFL